jgi:uncharacterized delta-60 repeat protein
MTTKLRVLGPVLLATFSILPTFGQSANDGFATEVSGDELASVRTTVVQADGRIVLGGHFASVGGSARSHLARLNTDGSLDTTFDPSIGSPVPSDFVAVFALVVQPDGKIIVGGDFATVAGQERHNLVRLTPDGSVDTSFIASADRRVECLALQADGKVLVGGWFQSLNDQSCSRLGRLNADGSLDTSFVASANSTVSSIAVQTDGKIVVSGTFDRMNGVQRASLARLDPTGLVDPVFTAELSDSACSIAIQPDGKIVLGGDFEIVNGQPRPFIVRLNRDGTVDDAFNSEAGDNVKCLVLQPDGRVLVGGEFLTLGGQPRQHVGRLLPDGSLDVNFDPGANAGVLSLAVQADDKILVGGEYTTLCGTSRSRFGRLYPDGRLDATLYLTPNGQVLCFAVQPDAKVIIGGGFTTLGGQPRERLARLNPDSSVDSGFNPEIRGGAVWCVLVQADGKVVVGCNAYAVIGGQSNSVIGRLNADGTRDSSFMASVSYVPHPSRTIVNSLAVQPDGKILVGGFFTRLSDRAQSHFGRLNPDGTADGSFSPQLDVGPNCIVVQPDGKIMIGGVFGTVNGEVHSLIARLNSDGTLDNFQTSAGGTTGAFSQPQVNALAFQPDGKILVGGLFTMLGGQGREYLGRLNPDGSVDASFIPRATVGVNSLIVQADGKILMVDNWSDGSGGRPPIVRVNGDGSTDNSFSPAASGGAAGAPDGPYALAAQADGKILVGGNFTVLGNYRRTNLGRLTGGSTAWQQLTLDSTGTAAIWSHGGAGPEVHQVTFEQASAANPTNFTPLGRGIRIEGGWQLTGLSLPIGETFYLRARGRTGGGYYSASSGLIESVRQFYLSPRIRNLAKGTDGNLTVTGTSRASQICVLLTTSSLTPSIAWTPIATNTADINGMVIFPGLEQTNSPNRFYRMQCP